MACVITHLQHGTNFIPYVESPSHGAGHPSLSVEVFNQGKNMSNSSSAPEPVATPSYSVAPSIAVFPFKTANQAVACFTAKASKTSEKVSFTSKGAS